MAYLVKMDEYWWSLSCILVDGRFSEGVYTLPSGTIVHEKEPRVFVEEQQQASEKALESFHMQKSARATGRLVQEEKAELEKMKQSLSSLKTSLKRKQASVNALLQNQSSSRRLSQRLKQEALEHLKTATGN
jgi:hypothetical protein